jgi:hypothetical protein
MRRIIMISSGLLAALALAVPLAFAQEAVAVGKRADVELSAETRVGSASLKPGHYQLQHQFIDGQHYLVVRAQSTIRRPDTGTHWAGATTDEVARVACRVVSTDTKQRQTALYTSKDADGASRKSRFAVSRGATYSSNRSRNTHDRREKSPDEERRSATSIRADMSTHDERTPTTEFA